MSGATGDVLEVGPIEDGRAFVNRIAPLMKPPHQWKFKPLFLGHLDSPTDLGEHEWLIEDWMSVGDLSVVGGARQSGKTFWSLHAGMCIAHNMEFFGLRVKPGLVIYQTGEGQRGFLKRLRAWRAHHGIVFSDETPFVPLLGTIDLFHDKDRGGHTDALIEEIKAIVASFPDHPLQMVVIDTLAMATIGADEISGKDMGFVLANVARIREKVGCHVQLVTHLNAGGSKIRGHTSIEANVDTVVTIVVDEQTKIRTCTLEKQKDGEAGIVMKYELLGLTLGDNPQTGKPITSCVCLPVGEKAAIKREEEHKGFRLKPEEVNFMRAFFLADRRFGMPVPEALETPSGVRTVVDYTEVKRAYGQSTPDDDGELDAPREGESEEDAARRKSEREKKRSARLSKKLGVIRERLAKFGIIGFGQMAGDPRWFGWWTGKPLRDFPATQPKRREPEPEGAPVAGEEPGQFEDIPW